MAEIFGWSRTYHEPHLIGVLRHGHRNLLGLLGVLYAVYFVIVDVLAGSILEQHHIADAESSVKTVAVVYIGALIIGYEIIAVEVFARVGIRQFDGSGTHLWCREFRSYLGSGCRYLQRNHVETCALRTAGKCHLILLVAYGRAAVVKVADECIAVRLAGIEIPGCQAAGVVEIHLVEFIGTQMLQVHQRLVEIGSLLAHLVLPHLRYDGEVVVILGKIVEEPVALVAVPLVGEGIVVGVAEEADALVVHQFREGDETLPLGTLFPDARTLSDRVVEAHVYIGDASRLRCIGIAHVLEGVTHLVSYGMSHRLAGVRTEPEGWNGEVVSGSVAYPVGGMVQQNHTLVFVDV